MRFTIITVLFAFILAWYLPQSFYEKVGWSFFIAFKDECSQDGYIFKHSMSDNDPDDYWAMIFWKTQENDSYFNPFDASVRLLKKPMLVYRKYVQIKHFQNPVFEFGISSLGSERIMVWEESINKNDLNGWKDLSR